MRQNAQKRCKKSYFIFYANVYGRLNVKKQKAVFAALSCFLDNVNFLHFAMHLCILMLSNTLVYLV